MDLSTLPTEMRRTDLDDLDQRSPLDQVMLMIDDTSEVVAALGAAAPSIAAAVDRIAAHLARGNGRIIYIGAGTAGRIGLLDAAECGPTFNTDRVTAILAGGGGAFETSKEAAEDDRDAAAMDLDAVDMGPSDVVIGISASGRTPYTVAAVRHAADVGALTVGVSCNLGMALTDVADLPIEVGTGPELLAGSTRLKAGTAQKIVCNSISTGVMSILGKTYGTLMVDVRATNEKLRQRAQGIVAQAAQTDLPTATEALRAADGDVKAAIVALRLGITTSAATGLVTASGGSVRAALAAGAQPDADDDGAGGEV